jgi:hypothetical protein
MPDPSRRVLRAAFVPFAIFSCASTSAPIDQRSADPPPSAGHALVYHTALGSVVLVNAGLGGMNAPPSTARTTLWRWDGATWTVLDSSGPPIRNLGGVAYDSHRDRIVMQGGSYSVDLVYDETWEWSRAGGWSLRSTGGPGRRDHTDMVFDAERRRTVLFGGQTEPGTNAAGTWLWDGSSWQVANVAAGPAPRIHHTMVFDHEQRRVLLFGGRSGGTTFGDTWAWNGSAWEQAASQSAARSHARLGMTAEGPILVGGLEGTAVSRLAGGAWTVSATTATPGSRYLPAIAYDPQRQVTVLFGGGDPATDQLLSDTWEFAVTTGWRRILP